MTDQEQTQTTEQVVKTEGQQQEQVVKNREQEAKNKTIALQQEREKAKQVEAKLQEYITKEQEALEKEKLKKGKFEELLTEKEQKMKEMEDKINSLSPIAEKYNTILNDKLESYFKKIPDSEKEFVNSLIDGKDFEQKVQILEKITQKFGGDYSPSSIPGAKAGVDISVKDKNSGDAFTNLAKMLQ